MRTRGSCPGQNRALAARPAHAALAVCLEELDITGAVVPAPRPRSPAEPLLRSWAAQGPSVSLLLRPRTSQGSQPWQTHVR